MLDSQRDAYPGLAEQNRPKTENLSYDAARYRLMVVSIETRASSLRKKKQKCLKGRILKYLTIADWEFLSNNRSDRPQRSRRSRGDALDMKLQVPIRNIEKKRLNNSFTLLDPIYQNAYGNVSFPTSAQNLLHIDQSV